MSIDYKTIGNRIKQHRKNAKKTQENMAEALYVTVGYISQIERGATRVNLDTLSEIASYLNCDISELIVGTSPDQKNYLEQEIMKNFNELSEKNKKILLEISNVLKSNNI